MKLRVIQPFGQYEVGQDITDAAEVKAILDSEASAYVVRVADSADTQAPAQ